MNNANDLLEKQLILLKSVFEKQKQNFKDFPCLYVNQLFSEVESLIKTIEAMLPDVRKLMLSIINFELQIQNFLETLNELKPFATKPQVIDDEDME